MYQVWVMNPEEGVGGVLNQGLEIEPGGVPGGFELGEVDHLMPTIKAQWPVVMVIDQSLPENEWLAKWRLIRRWHAGLYSTSVENIEKALFTIIDHPFICEADGLPYKASWLELGKLCPALLTKD